MVTHEAVRYGSMRPLCVLVLFSRAPGRMTPAYDQAVHLRHELDRKCREPRVDSFILRHVQQVLVTPSSEFNAR